MNCSKKSTENIQIWFYTTVSGDYPRDRYKFVFQHTWSLKFFWMEGCRISRTDIEKVTAEFLLDGRRHRLYHLNWLNKQDQGKFNTVQLFLLKKSYLSKESSTCSRNILTIICNILCLMKSNKPPGSTWTQSYSRFQVRGCFGT